MSARVEWLKKGQNKHMKVSMQRRDNPDCPRQGGHFKSPETRNHIDLLISSKVKVITSKFHFTACFSKKKTLLLVRELYKKLPFYIIFDNSFGI